MSRTSTEETASCRPSQSLGRIQSHTSSFPLISRSSNCFYCKNGFSSRCVKSALFGSSALDGAQAEYVRVPYADGTLIKAPIGMEKHALTLMGDIFPTGGSECLLS